MKRNYFFISGLLCLFFTVHSPAPKAQLLASGYAQQKDPSSQSAWYSVETILKELEARHSIYFMYESDKIRKIQVPYRQIPGEDVRKTLDRILKSNGLDYKKHGKIYGIFLKSSDKQSVRKLRQELQNRPSPEKVISLQLPVTSLNPVPSPQHIDSFSDKTVQGKVLSQDDNEALPGVSVLVKGTSRGTTTDAGGNFRLEVPDSAAVLVLSYVGYISQEITVDNQSFLNIKLAVDNKALEEVVVVGYGSAKKKDLTGSLARVDLERSRLQPNINPVQNLRGTVAGVTVTDNGRPGSDASIMIRGRNSISASNSPLIVLDGIIYAGGSLSDINSNDIESIDILKDASSSAIYGSLAANGVILITTKKGTSTRPRINYNAYFGTSDFAHAPEYRNAEQYLQARKDAEIMDNGPLPFQVLEEQNIAAGIVIDPWEEIKRRAPVHSNELSVSGRSDRVNYYFSGSYSDIKSPVKGDNFKRLAARVNLDIAVTDWLSIGTNSGYSSRDNSGVRASLLSASQLSPFANLYYDDGLPRPKPMSIGAVSNPLTATLLNWNLDETNTLFTNTYADVTLPLPGLTYRLNVGYTQRNIRRYDYTPTFQREQFFNLGSGSRYNQHYHNTTIENIVRYDRTIGKGHDLNFTFLYGTYVTGDESSTMSSNNIFNDALGYNALQVGENFSINTTAGKSQQLSTMGRLGYRYKGKYIMDLTMRRDGYSAFGKGRKFGLFPAVGLSWNLSEEHFISRLSVIDNLKLRASWGKNGNRGVSRYSSLSNMTQSYYVFGDGGSPSVGLYTTSLSNPELGWETTVSTNFGVDFGFFAGRLSGSVDYYQTRTNDLLLNQSIPNMSGFTTFLRNIGETANKGLEIALNTVNFRRGSFEWNTNIVFALNRNKIVRLTGNDQDGDGIEDDDISSGWFIGHPLGSQFDYVFDGIYQEGDEDLSLLAGSRPGHVKFRDLNGDGIITPQDRTIIGSDQANFTTGITNTFSYKGLSLMVLFNLRQGGQSRNSILNAGTNYYDLMNTLNLPYWMPDNPINTYPAINYRNPLGYGFYQSRSFVRLQDVALSYDVPVSLLQKIKVSNLKVYVSGKNLVTWTKWNGWDPEHGAGSNRNPGENGPLLKTYTIGLNLQL